MSGDWSSDVFSSDLIFDKQNYHVGEFIQVRITDATSATLFGESIAE